MPPMPWPSWPNAAHVVVEAARVNERHVRLTALVVTLGWVHVLHRAAQQVPTATPVTVLVAAGLGAQLAFSLLEAGLSSLLWRALGARVGVTTLLPRVLAASAAEVFAIAILIGDVPLSPRLAALLCGARAWPGAWAESGLARAWAATGLLALVRITLSAHAQARVAEAPFSRGLAVVGSLHLFARLALWWGSELILGHSFQS